MRILHAAFQMWPSAGIAQQMAWEQSAATRLGLQWNSSLRIGVDRPGATDRMGMAGRTLRAVAARRSYHSWLLSVISSYDLVLLRYSSHDLLELKLVRDYGQKVLTVHHSLEMAELRSKANVGSGLKASMEKVIGANVLREVAGVVGVTEEIVTHQRNRASLGPEVPSFVYPNGVVCAPAPGPDERSVLPTFVFIATNFVSWHGFDLLLDALQADRTPCQVDVVGVVPEALRKRAVQEPRVILHGYIEHSDIQPLLARAWCGLSSLALERKGMREACTLKVRQYLDFGLPVFAGHRDSGLPSSFPYFRQGQPVLSEMLSYAEACRCVSRQVVKEASAPHIEKASLVGSLYRDLEATFSRG